MITSSLIEFLRFIVGEKRIDFGESQPVVQPGGALF
jgi:hypothetical protein